MDDKNPCGINVFGLHITSREYYPDCYRVLFDLNRHIMSSFPIDKISPLWKVFDHPKLPGFRVSLMLDTDTASIDFDVLVPSNAGCELSYNGAMISRDDLVRIIIDLGSAGNLM